MKYEIEHDEHITTLTIQNSKLDTEVAPELKSQLIILSNADEQNHLILDLQNIEFADSSGLSALLLAHRLYRDNDRLLVLCNLQERVSKLIEISHLTDSFEITDTHEEAEARILSDIDEEE